MNLFETLLHPDREELELKERAVVCSAANALQVGEFQLLQLAYRDWYDQDMPEAMMDRLFASYMIKNEVPHWARHYARRIMEQDAKGGVDDKDPAFHRYDSDYHTSVPHGVRRFWVATVGLFVAVGGIIAVANLTVTESSSILPPYFDEEDLRPVQDNFSWGRSDTLVPIPRRGGVGPGS